MVTDYYSMMRRSLRPLSSATLPSEAIATAVASILGVEFRRGSGGLDCGFDDSKTLMSKKGPSINPVTAVTI
jgi:hypothetical protein